MASGVDCSVMRCEAEGEGNRDGGRAVRSMPFAIASLQLFPIKISTFPLSSYLRTIQLLGRLGLLDTVTLSRRDVKMAAPAAWFLLTRQHCGEVVNPELDVRDFPPAFTVIDHNLR
jgi:hypothetical protein